MRTLKIFLWISAIGCLLSGFGIFLPISTWEAIAKLFGVESLGLPDSPLFEYAVRVSSAMAVAMGAFFVILALHPMKYPAMVPFSGLAAVFLGVVCGITGLTVGMSPLWFLGDSLSCLIVGVLILVSWQQVKRTSGS
jgi:hypothetical protein